jgi:membrane protease subunit HflK
MRYFRWLLLALVVAYALTGIVQVRPGERAVVRRFGRVLPQKPEPGLWVGLPWGMDRVDRVNVDRVQSVVVGFQDEEGADQTVPAGQLLTGDHNLVNVQATLYYKVQPEHVEDYVTQADRVDGLLARAVESVMAEWVSGRDVDDVLLNGKNELRRALVELSQEKIEGYGLGVQLLSARVSLIAPPAEVKDAFDAVALEQTKNTTRRNQAEEEVERKLRQARADCYSLEQTTAAYVRNHTLLAQRDAERFLERLRQYEEGRKTNPAYLRQIWEEERGKLFARLRETGQIDLLDHHLGSEGLDLITAPPRKP